MSKHKVLIDRDITADNLALLTDEEFINANRSFIEKINEHKEIIASNQWIPNEDIDEYIATFRKAEDANGKGDYPRLRKEVEGIIEYWDKGYLNCKRPDIYDDEFYEITDSLYLNMQHTDYLADEEWHEKYKDLTADKRSEVVELRKAASDYVDFPNPYRKGMEAAWRLPDGYDDEQIYDAIIPLAEFLPKAITLYDQGDIKSALGISFDLFDMLMVMMACELQFFMDGDLSTKCTWALAEVTLYPICKIYNDQSVAQEVKTEIKNRIEAYGKIYSFPEKLGFGKVYTPDEVFRTFGTFGKELDFYDFFGLNPYYIHEAEDTAKLSDEEYETWRQKIFKDVSTIGDCHKLSTEELSNLNTVLMDMYLFPNEDIEQVCSIDQFKSTVEGVKAELLSRLAKSSDRAEQSMILQTLHNMNWLCKYDFTDDVIAIEKQLESNTDDNTIRSWATTQNKDGSWPGVSADEAYRRIRVLGNIAYKVADVDKDRITFLAYNYYSQTSCTTAKELYSKYMAYETKYRRPDEEAPSFAHRQAIAMLQSESLPLADRLLLNDFLL